MLARTEGTTLVFEPDNHQMFPFAVKAKRNLLGGYYPLPAAGSDLHLYERLWREAFGDRGTSFTRTERARRSIAHRLLRWRRDAHVLQAFTTGKATWRLRLAETLAVPERPESECSNIVVKSVYTPLAVEWIAELVGARVLVVLRDLRNVVSSWNELGWIVPVGQDELAASGPELHERIRREFAVPPVSTATSAIGRLTWLLALYTTVLEDAARRNPAWSVVRHEEAVSNLPHSLEAVARALGLQWSPQADQAIAAAARPGRGFETKRDPGTLRNAWAERLTEAQATEIDAILAGFPLESRNQD